MLRCCGLPTPANLVSDDRTGTYDIAIPGFILTGLNWGETSSPTSFILPLYLRLLSAAKWWDRTAPRQTGIG